MKPFKVNSGMFIDREGEDILVSLSATYLPGYKGSQINPPESPGLEDITATYQGQIIDLDKEQTERATEKLLEAAEYEGD